MNGFFSILAQREWALLILFVAFIVWTAFIRNDWHGGIAGGYDNTFEILRPTVSKTDGQQTTQFAT